MAVNFKWPFEWWHKKKKNNKHGFHGSAMPQAEGGHTVVVGFWHGSQKPPSLKAAVIVVTQWLRVHRHSVVWLDEFHLPASVPPHVTIISTRRFHSSRQRPSQKPGRMVVAAGKRKSTKTLKQRLINLFRCSHGKHGQPISAALSRQQRRKTAAPTTGSTTTEAHFGKELKFRYFCSERCLKAGKHR